MTFRDSFYFAAGIGFLAMAKAKNALHGYTTPKPIDISETQRCIDYAFNAVDDWLRHLNEFTNGAFSVEGKSVLELGPGSDLGIGLALLAKGCAQYNACDVHNLAANVPDAFYEQFFQRLKDMNPATDTDLLERQLSAWKAGNPAQLNYVVRPDFDLVTAFGKSTVDLVVSLAAFEHFDDIDSTIAQMSQVCKSGAIVILDIDLQTHSRWIREKDPNNIYRFPELLYRAFWFRGIPNRKRPYQYRMALERHGWADITVTPLKTTNSDQSSYSGMQKQFCDQLNQMDCLTVLVCARKL